MNKRLLASLNNVSKIFSAENNSVTAVKNVSLDIYQGDFISITGVSGSGKTTLLNIIAGLMLPTEGAIIFNGDVDLGKLTDKKRTSFRRRNIGMIFQDLNLLPNMTAMENIEFPLLIHNTRLDECGRQLLTQLMKKLGLESAAHRYPYEMSGGEQQRTAIARAMFPSMLNNKKRTILLADEPSANLDSQNAENIGNIFLDLNENLGQTIILATHDTRLANKAKTHMELSNGQIGLRMQGL